MNNTNQSLQNYLDEQEQVEREAFTIQDDQAANWALRKIGQMQKQIKDNNALAVSEVDKIEAWNKQENQKAQDSIDYFQGLLSYYALSKREEDPKFKTLKLPNGAIKFRKQQPKYNYDDEVLTEHLKLTGRDDLIKVKESPDKTAVKKSFKIHDGKLVNPETGEFVEGVTVEQREDAFKVEVMD